MFWLWVIVIATILLIMYRRREGLSPNAYEMSQMQLGELSKIETQLKEIKLNREMVDEVKQCSKDNQNNVIEIHKNMSMQDQTGRPDAYPRKVKPASFPKIV
jgi:hypothetical protein